MEGFGTYAVVAALMLNASLRIYTGTSTPNELDKRGRVSQSVPGLVFLLSTAITFLLSLHSTVTFTLIPIYAKTCLGLSLDHKFTAFLASTEWHRKCGFRTFLGSIVCFLISFCTAFYMKVITIPKYKLLPHNELKSPDLKMSKLSYAISVALSVTAAAMVATWWDIIKKASMIFA